MRTFRLPLDPRLWLLPLLLFWALLALQPFTPKTASGQNSALETASTAGDLRQAPPRLGFRVVPGNWMAVPLVAGKGIPSIANDEILFNQIVPGGGLQAHENAGGHLLEKHAGLSEQQLVDRLAVEPRISGSSSFYDRATAENAISEALDARQTDISNWLSGSSGRFRLDYSGSDLTGISVSRGSTNAVDVGSVRVILVRDASAPTGYKILTGFPTSP